MIEKDIKKIETEELKKKLISLYEEKYKFYFDNSTGKEIKDNNKYNKIKKEISRILTELNQRNNKNIGKK